MAQDPGHGPHLRSWPWAVEVRILKVATVAGLCFPRSAQAIQVIRRVRQADSRTWRTWRTVTVYAVTRLTIRTAGPAQLAGYLRGRWTIENQLHYVRDVTFSEDTSNARTAASPA